MNFACCACEALLFLFLLGTASRSLFARRFFALRPCVCRCALCFRLSGLKDGIPFHSCICPREWLATFVSEAVGVSAGRRFFALCLRGGSSPSDLAFSSLLSGLLVGQVFGGLLAVSSLVSSHAVA